MLRVWRDRPFHRRVPQQGNDYYKKGKGYSRDSDKYHSGKQRSKFHPSKKKDFWKAFRSYREDNYKRDKAFFTEIFFLFVFFLFVFFLFVFFIKLK